MTQVERPDSGSKIRDFCGRLSGETPLLQVYKWYLNSSLASRYTPGSELYNGHLAQVTKEFRAFYDILDRGEKFTLGRLVSKARESLPNVDAVRRATIEELKAKGFRDYTAQQLKDMFEPIDS
ncbi:MAG TPA: hypothetical protein VLG44_03400, partial [Chlamydiales bacterium]|nr:hypothetical protein [Chlamydiales bacterium]